MGPLDANLIRRSLAAESSAQLAELEVFGSIASTNTYLMSQPPPDIGRFRVAIADHQSSGRGRHFRRWLSPPGAGICLSFAYTFEEQPENLPSLTLAIGVGVVNALETLGMEGISLKWPNDIVANDGKLGGILTELQSSVGAGVTVVIGIGLNVSLPLDTTTSFRSDWAKGVVDLASICGTPPLRSIIAAAIIDELFKVMKKFAALGFVVFAEDWSKLDWLKDRGVSIDTPDGTLSGSAAGVDKDGALLVDAEKGQVRVVSGSVAVAGLHGQI